MKPQQHMHFTANYLLNPTNPIVVNIIGAGGTGSQMLTALSRMHHSLQALGHPGLHLQCFDGDKVKRPNLGRQLFSSCDLGQYKAVVLINRINRFFGTNFKAFPKKYNRKHLSLFPEQGAANITITCVDEIAARLEIASILPEIWEKSPTHVNKPLYWMDIGNSQFTGQVILSTVGTIPQPSSKKYIPANNLPFISDEYKPLLDPSNEDTTPSCSLADALKKQDLYINSTLANLGASLLWNLLREGMIENRGFFLNLREFRMNALKVGR